MRDSMSSRWAFKTASSFTLRFSASFSSVFFFMADLTCFHLDEGLALKGCSESSSAWSFAARSSSILSRRCSSHVLDRTATANVGTPSWSAPRGLASPLAFPLLDALPGLTGSLRLLRLDVLRLRFASSPAPLPRRPLASLPGPTAPAFGVVPGGTVAGRFLEDPPALDLLAPVEVPRESLPTPGTLLSLLWRGSETTATPLLPRRSIFGSVAPSDGRRLASSALGDISPPHR
mmetsp:Transcript_14001/g.41199  ORF Transcript_14001/g.41199 Transcript_14001/m.41199 type:complete len:233 (-) Transcript_14001:10-708(-)